jgi:signal transduction histidine kinase
MGEAAVTRQLMSAELWATARPATPASPPPSAAADPQFLAGWEDASPFCAAVCQTDVGLAFCRRCPTDVVREATRTGRPASTRCPAGVRLLAFPVPRPEPEFVAVLRTAPPEPRQAAGVADQVRVSATTLRRAARDADPADGRETLAAARRLSSPDGLRTWQVEQRARESDRRRTAEAARAQMIATSDEFYELYRQEQRDRAKLERNRRELDRLARETLRAKDDERALIAHQIHDTAAQSLVSAFRFLEAARSAPGNGSRRPSEYLESATERVQEAIREIRHVLDRLLPPGLEELGLAKALDSRLRQLTAGTTIDARLVGDLPRMEPWVEQAIYGMVAEAISNAIRHGRPASIRIGLGTPRGRATIEIEDDGVGFDPRAIGRRSDGGGLGLVGLTRQASWLGGKATIATGPGGTTIRIAIPIEAHRAKRAASVGDAT